MSRGKRAAMVVSCLALSASVSARQDLQMMTYQMVLLHGVSGKSAPAADAPAMQQAHLDNLIQLNRNGVNHLFGPFLDHPDTLEGLAILEVKDAEAARAAFANDPYVKGGFMTVEVLPWYGPKGWFQKPAEPFTPENFVFGFLMRATPATPPPPDQGKQIQQAHLSYMDELHKQGKLVAAGPFGGTGDRRGIVIYRVPSVDDAQKLAADDPAVKAGLLRLDARRWMTFKGILK